MPDASISELQNQLQDVLSGADLNISAVLSLATELAKNDPDQVRFFSDAGIIRRLGEELVSRKETAVAELVKNAYDADATYVEILFEGADTPGGTLEILDDGHGMSRDDLINGFMRLASQAKVRESTSPRFGRQRAGRKGIGRFAVQRLGDYLEIRTKLRENEHALCAEIDWRDFEAGRDLTSVATTVEHVAWHQSDESGTLLTIGDLHDKWTEAQMRRIWRYVSDLVQPFPVSEISAEEESKDGYLPDPGFTPKVLRVTSSGELESVADEEEQIWEYETAYIEAGVNNEGNGWWVLESNRFPEVNENLVPIGADPEDPSVPFQYLRNIRLEAHYFIYASELMPPMMMRTIQGMSEDRGGIRLYRNGFRVWPYGSKGDDWLGLDKAKANRKVLAAFGSNNFFGHINLHDPEGDIFEETSSREGLINHKALEELQNFAFRILRAGVLRVAEARDKKGLASGKSRAEVAPEDKIESALKGLQGIMESVQSDPEQDPSEAVEHVERQIEDVRSATENLVSQSNEREQELQDELSKLRVLASLGIVIGEFTHEVKGRLSSARASVATLNELELEPSPAPERAADLSKEVERIQSYTSYFDRTVRENAKRELRPLELGEVISDFEELMAKPGLEIDTEFRGFELWTRPMHRSEIESVLFNFYSNSLKAIKRANVSPGRISIRSGRKDEGEVYFDFADNGDGIDEETSERMYNAFFTTSTYGNPFSEEDQDLAAGSGLGLKIVRDIVEGYEGEVDLINPPSGYSTCFRVKLPAASEEQIEKMYTN